MKKTSARSTTIGAVAIFLVAVTVLFSGRRAAQAEEFTSASFKILDPVITIGAGRITSGSFTLQGSIGQPAIGISDAASFGVRGGFLYFPVPAAATPAAGAEAAAAAGGGVLESFLKTFGLTPPRRLPSQCPLPADLDCDGRVNLRDLSVFLFLTPRPLPNPADLNRDQRVDLGDFSVLLTSWTERLFTAPEESRMAARGAISEEKRARTGFAFAGQGSSLAGEATATEAAGPRIQDYSQQRKKIIQAASSVVRWMNEFIAHTIARVRSSVRAFLR